MLERLLERKDYLTAKYYIKGWEQGEVEIPEEEIERALNCDHPKIVFLTVKSLFKRLPIERAKKIFKNSLGIEPLGPPVEFEFPTVSKSSGKLVKGLAFESSATFLKNQKNIAIVKELTQKEFAVFFDEEFIGESFQSPLAYALLYGEHPQNILLSGKLLPNGDFKAEFKEKKEEIAKRKGKFLIAEGNIHEIHSFFSKNFYELPFLIAIGNREKNIKDFFFLSEKVRFKPLKGFLDEKDLIVELPPFLPYDESWEKFFTLIKENILKLKEKLSAPFALHIGLKKIPITFSLGTGAMLGTGKIPIAVYHYENGNYYRVIDLRKDSRRIKKRKKELSFIKIEEKTGESRTAVIALQLASHETRNKGKKLSQKFNADFFYINTPELKGNLPLDFDWTEVIAEIYEAFNRIYDRNYKKFHLVMSVPNPIALALGMAIGNYWDVEVWSYFQNLKDYVTVFNLGKVENL